MKDMSVAGDNPIRKPEDDVLGRSEVARSFAGQVLKLDASQGVVVGVLGPWGSGKTSFVNLARAYWREVGIPVLDFNPWMFSGTDHLVSLFFAELSIQLKLSRNLADVGRDLEAYGEIFSGMGWLPLVGPWAERLRSAVKILAKGLQRRKEGIGGCRKRVERRLNALDKPILVVLDDIDRLTSPEIRDVFKLVRLTASFPNVIYIVAFDRKRVEQALDEQAIPGRAYLEKILQVGVDLPVVPPHVLDRQIFEAIDEALSEIGNQGPFDKDAWPDVFAEIVRPLISSMRDVRRYAMAIPGTVRELDGNVALVDVLALEALRVFLPGVFRQMHQGFDGLATASEDLPSDLEEPTRLKQQIEGLIDAAGDAHGDVVRALIQRLFPTGARRIDNSNFGSEGENRWLRERRVAHMDVLRLYLERVAGEGLQAFNHAEQVWVRMADRAALESYLDAMAPDVLEDVISRLEVYQDEFAPQHAVPGAIALLNILPAMPERRRGMFDVLDTRMIVARVVLRLLRPLGDANAVSAAVRQILPELSTLSAKLELITIVGHRENAGHRLVSASTASQLEREWRAAVRSASFEDVMNEPELLEVLFRAKRDAGSAEPPLDIADLPEMTLAILRSARSEAQSQEFGSRAIRRSPRLAWDVLIELYGDESTIRERTEMLKATLPEGNDELIQLVDDYLGGRRPRGLRREGDEVVRYSPESPRRSAVDMLAEAPGRRVLQTAEEVESYLKEERAAWDR